MATAINDSPLKKAYMDISNTINGINRDVTFYNIKTAIKTYATFLGAFSIGYGSAWACSAILGAIAGIFIAFPAAMLASIALGRYVTGKMNNALLKKGKEIDAAVNKSMEKYGHDIKRAMHLDGCINGLLPFTIQKITLDSFEEVQKRYDGRSFVRRWTPDCFKSA